MAKTQALTAALAASMLLAVASCGASPEEDQPPPAKAEEWVKEIQDLQQKISAVSADAAESRTGGGRVSAGEDVNLWFDPLTSGPIDAKFICDAGSVSVSISGDQSSDVACGQVREFKDLEPYETGAGLSIEVSSDQDALWAVEFSTRK